VKGNKKLTVLAPRVSGISAKIKSANPLSLTVVKTKVGRESLQQIHIIDIYGSICVMVMGSNMWVNIENNSMNRLPI
jgi:hypothetical protein